MNILEPAQVDANGKEHEDVLQANDPVDLLLLRYYVVFLSSYQKLLRARRWKQPLLDFCVGDLTALPSLNGFPCKPLSEVISEDFFFDGLREEGNTSNALGSMVAVGNVLAFPGVNTLGISMNRVDIAAGGLNPPHLHPRATESGFVVEGRVLVGFLTTDNVFYSKVLSAGQMFVIPRGLVHFQMNVGEGKALLITAFNSQLPGAVIVASNLFGATPPVPDEVLEKAFQVEESVVADIKGKFGA